MWNEKGYVDRWPLQIVNNISMQMSLRIYCQSPLFHIEYYTCLEISRPAIANKVDNIDDLQ